MVIKEFDIVKERNVGLKKSLDVNDTKSKILTQLNNKMLV